MSKGKNWDPGDPKAGVNPVEPAVLDVATLLRERGNITVRAEGHEYRLSSPSLAAVHAVRTSSVKLSRKRDDGSASTALIGKCLRHTVASIDGRPAAADDATWQHMGAVYGEGHPVVRAAMRLCGLYSPEREERDPT